MIDDSKMFSQEKIRLSFFIQFQYLFYRASWQLFSERVGHSLDSLEYVRHCGFGLAGRLEYQSMCFHQNLFSNWFALLFNILL